MVRRATRTLLAALVVLVGSCLIAELAWQAMTQGPAPDTIRARLDEQNRIHPEPSVPDPVLGARMPGSLSTVVRTPDYEYTLQTDQDGFPNRDPWPGSVDVVVLGNSLITGAGVGLEGQFTTLLQREFGAGTVLNLGLPDGGTEHQRRIFQQHAAALKPKVVVATLWLLYEIDNGLIFQRWLDGGSSADYSHHLDASMPKSREGVFRSTLRWMLDRSHLLRFVRHTSRRLRGSHETVDRVVLPGGDDIYLSADEQTRLLRGWQRPEATDLPNLVFQPLERLRDDAERIGATFLVVLVPSKEELYAGPAIPALLDVVREARRELAARGLRTLDLYPAFAAAPASYGMYFRADLHHNAAGHRLIAQAVAQELAAIRRQEGAAADPAATSARVPPSQPSQPVK